MQNKKLRKFTAKPVSVPASVPARKAAEEGELQVIYAEVYLPNTPDFHGDFMDEEGVRQMAWTFLARNANADIDVNHDHGETTCSFVESFVAREGDPDFTTGAWVVAIHIPDVKLWRAVKDGEINGLSFEGMAVLEDEQLEVIIKGNGIIMGETLPDPNDGHVHSFMVEVTEEGKIQGRTDFADGHAHVIEVPTHTQKAQGHTHRFAFWDAAEPEVVE